MYPVQRRDPFWAPKVQVQVYKPGRNSQVKGPCIGNLWKAGLLIGGASTVGANVEMTRISQVINRGANYI
jgi:hypothetical protein